MIKRSEFYGRLRTAGLLAIIPIILVSGPLGGYLIADLLVKKLNFPGYAIAVCVTMGFITGVREVIKIIGMAIKSGGRG